MTPGNSVKEIESFVETSLASITPENCQERMPKRSGDSRDFFLQSRSRVYDAVRKRCSQFVEGNARRCLAAGKRGKVDITQQ